MPKARLLHKMRVRIAQPIWEKWEQDTVWRENVDDIEEIVFHPTTPTSIILAQVAFNPFELMTPKDTGDDQATTAYIIIDKRTQLRKKLEKNDYIIAFLPRRAPEMRVFFKILEVRPVAQRSSFELYKVIFTKEAKTRG